MEEQVDRLAQRIIIDWVVPRASVLELGCGNGSLLSALIGEKEVKAQGVEMDGENVSICVQRGLNVVHETVDESLKDYGAARFEYSIFNESLQRVSGKPDIVIQDALRVSRNVIIRFSNFAHYRARWQMFFDGKTPVTPSLPYEWHDTPNLHFLSIADFGEYCAARGITVERTAFLGERRVVCVLPNIMALSGIFMISKATTAELSCQDRNARSKARE